MCPLCLTAAAFLAAGTGIAAGFTGMGGALLEGHGHHLGWAFTSGRFAGRYAASEVVSADIPEAADAKPAVH